MSDGATVYRLRDGVRILYGDTWAVVVGSRRVGIDTHLEQPIADVACVAECERASFGVGPLHGTT
jgi:hypothetical protein